MGKTLSPKWCVMAAVL